MAFIRERQAEVLSDAIAQLTSCTAADLPAVVHSAYGTVGSYRLDDAHEAIASLAAVLSEPRSTGADIEAARAATIDVLTTLATDRTS
jgi:hypothetical protein